MMDKHKPLPFPKDANIFSYIAKSASEAGSERLKYSGSVIGKTGQGKTFLLYPILGVISEEILKGKSK